ncbi:MAG TPA: hypothetical protein VFC80_00305 [Sphaerochaeta sp.]|nr:hypothetical protein [Sphaerochaeta sp.]
MSAHPFPTPRFSPLCYAITRLLGRTYLRRVLGVKTIEQFHAHRYSEALDSFKRGERRLILAFRHTAVEDAPLLLVGTAKKSHLSFLYGRDVLNWAGASARIFFPRLAFIAVQNRGSSRAGLTHLRQAATNGRFPLALAPEGQVTYHAHRCGPLESGVAQLALWAGETGAEVTILPVAIAYRYSDDSASLLTDLLVRWQQESGFRLEVASPEQLLATACENTLELVASHWKVALEAVGSFTARRDHLCAALLEYAEEEAGLGPQTGSIIDRLYRLRFFAEDTLFGPQEGISLEQRERTHSYLIALQTVDVLEYLDPSYITEEISAARMVEVALTLLDVTNRIAGGSIDSRYSPKEKVGGLYFGEPIDLSATAPAGNTRKERIAQIMAAVADGLTQSSAALEEEWTLHF